MLGIRNRVIRTPVNGGPAVVLSSWGTQNISHKTIAKVHTKFSIIWPRFWNSCCQTFFEGHSFGILARCHAKIKVMAFSLLLERMSVRFVDWGTNSFQIDGRTDDWHGPALGHVRQKKSFNSICHPDWLLEMQQQLLFDHDSRAEIGRASRLCCVENGMMMDSWAHSLIDLVFCTINFLKWIYRLITCFSYVLMISLYC